MNDCACPTEDLAIRIAAGVIGDQPLNASRFTTGSSHYVYEVWFADRPSVVVRIGDRGAHRAMQGATQLSHLLRPLGVPLPAILAVSLETELPWLILERLPGTDLGKVIATLDGRQLDRLAGKIAEAEASTARTKTAGRYGYAATPESAPFATWSQVLDAGLDRSRRRIAAAGLFEPALANPLCAAVAAQRAELDRIAPTPFLHDTTTKNVIVTDDGHLSGIVDVDDLCFGDPRYPAALTLAVLTAYGGPVQYVSAWLRHAGRPDDPIFRLYVGLFILDLMAEHGQVFNGNELPSDDEARAALRKAFENNLGLIMA